MEEGQVLREQLVQRFDVERFHAADLGARDEAVGGTPENFTGQPERRERDHVGCELPTRELLPACKCGEQFRDHQRRRVKHQDGTDAWKQECGKGERRPAADLGGVAAHDEPQRRAQALRITVGIAG